MASKQTLLAILLGAIGVAAHGHVDDVVIDGAFYQAYDVTTLPYMADPPVVVGWSTTATDNGFVAPDAFGNADIICHRGAENAGGFATVEAGDSIMFEWDTWPESHHGPVIDYIAPCGDSCASIDKTTLEWTKIGEVGLIDGSSPPGVWGSDTLIQNGNRWIVTIPPTLAPGNYIVRHEIIALHSAGQQNGAQNYPQCISISVTGSGTDSPSDGVLGTELYQADDAGILFNIYTTMTTYPIPGPSLFGAAVEADQTVMEITATNSATTDGAVVATNIADSTAISEAVETTTAENTAEVTTTSVAIETTTSSNDGVLATSTASEITSTAAFETLTTATEAATTTTIEDAETSATSAETFATTRASCGSKRKKDKRHVKDIVAKA